MCVHWCNLSGIASTLVAIPQYNIVSCVVNTGIRQCRHRVQQKTLVEGVKERRKNWRVGVMEMSGVGGKCDDKRSRRGPRKRIRKKCPQMVNSN